MLALRPLKREDIVTKLKKGRTSTSYTLSGVCPSNNAATKRSESAMTNINSILSEVRVYIHACTDVLCFHKTINS